MRVGSFIENVEPELGGVERDGVGPLIQPVPVPSTTSSWVERTAPVVASVITCSRLGIAPGGR